MNAEVQLAHFLLVWSKIEARAFLLFTLPKSDPKLETFPVDSMKSGSRFFDAANFISPTPTAI